MNKNYSSSAPFGVGNHRLYFPLFPTFNNVDSSWFLSFSTLLIVTLLLSFGSIQAQTVYLTSSGGSFANEKWMSITTGANGTGTLVWSQGGITPYPTGTTGGGLVTNEAIDITSYCGQTLYLNAYDRYADSWDGTVYSLETAASGGTVIINNGGNSPNGAGNNDCNGSSWCDTDPATELEASESFSVACLCTDPAATFSLASNCPNDFSITVDLTATGDGATVDITNDGGVAATNGVGLGMYNIGPFALGANVTITVNADGGCSIDSGILTEACNCTTNPTATVASANLNCTTGMYDVNVTITSDGSGDANMSDILIDNVVVQADAMIGQLYTFSVATGMHDVQIQAENASFVTCEADYSTNEVCNGGDVCGDAVDITNSCSVGDLTAATVDGGALVENFLSCGNGSTIALCGANSSFTGSSYVRTDHTDIWYAVNPNGSDEVTVTISNLMNGNIMVLPYLTNGTCPTTTSDNDDMEDNIDNFSASLTNGNCPYFTADGSFTFQGNSLTTATTVYFRIMPYAENGSGATNCETLTYPTFDICTSIPQANDVCGDAIDIDNVSATGDLCAAGTETENSETGATCGEAAGTGDLWYEVTMDGADSDQFLEVDLTFPNPTDAVVVELYHNCFTNTFLECATVSSTGANSTVNHAFTSTISSGGFGPTWYVRVTPVAGNAVCNFTIEGTRVAENNNCEVMQDPFPGFDVENTNNDLDFNFSTDSGASPVIAGNDLWYQFSPVQTADPVTGLNTASTTAEIVIGGLAAGQELTLVLYKGEGISADNCTDLTGNYLETLVVTGNGTLELACLDELHLDTDGGYIIRVIQTAGTTIDNGLINVQPQPAGPYNNDCENIWGGSGPTNLGWTDPSPGPSDGINDGGLAVNFNPFVLEEGFSNYVSGDFENSTDCNPATASALCNSVDQQAIASNEDRDLWYVFQMPGSSSGASCDETDLEVSTDIDDVTFLWNAGSQFEDGIIYIYSDCGDANLIDCSGVLDGAPSGAGDAQFDDPQSTWTPTGLTSGQNYLIRVKPHDISSTGVGNEFDFDLSYKDGPVRPCNNDPDKAFELPVDACTDYSNLTTLSAQGASATTPVDGAPENDVWFKFTAPNPANGGSYTTSKSWVTVFFETVSGEGLFVELYNTSATQASGEVIQASGAGDQSWASFGNLNPGQEYFIRLYHKETASVNVQYKINITSGAAEEPGLGCGANAINNPDACSSGCDDLREQWFKIDLPDGTPGNAYWMIEVVGYDEHLDFELRSKYLSGSTAYNGCTGTEGALEGSCADFDHPCSSVALEGAVTNPLTTDLNSGADLTSGTMACDDSPTPATGQGTRRIYFNMNGAVTGQKDYYYLRVFMDPSDPNYATATDINICQLNFNGPYSTQALADDGGVPDLQCLSCDISDVAITTDGTCNGNNAEFTLNFDVANGSGDYEIFATANNATYGITTGDVLGTITSAGATGTDVAITGTVTNTSSAGTISVDIRDTNDPTGCLSGTPVTINIPVCSTCAADAGDLSNNSSSPNTLSVCEGDDLLDGATEIVFSADYTAGDEINPGAGYEYAFVLSNASGTIQSTNTDGNFDFSGLTSGNYTIHGISYSTSNTINTVAAYLSAITGDATVDDISQIETDETGAAICVDIDSGALTGQTTSVTINAAPSATVTTTATVCNVATETGEDEGQEDLDILVTSGDMTGTWTILSGNTGSTATITGTMAGGDVIFDAGTEAGPIIVQYTVTGIAPCTDVTYDVTITRIDCGVCAPAVGVTRSN